MRRRIRHVDAFTSTPLEGNPAAVVDGEGIDDATMQLIALNQHLSETVFLLPPEKSGNHARLRIFTPSAELPFAGHPTVAASHVLVSESIVRLGEGEALRLDTGAGLITVDVAATSPRYTMTQRPPEFRPAPHSRETIAAALGLAVDDVVRVEDVSTGIFWTIAQLASFDAMLRVRPDFMALQDIDVSLFCIGAGAPGVDVRVRTFATNRGVTEDPVTGSSNGCIAAFVAKHGLIPARDGVVTYVAEQGVEMGQPGRIHLRASGPADALVIEVGGDAVTVLEGDLLLPG
jgi:PhzF family phenazine biosynthesis protein